MSIATLDFTPDSISNRSFGVFVVDSPKEQYIFDTLQQWGQALVQNDKANFSDLIRMLRSNSSRELQSIIEQSEQQRQQQEQALQQQATEGQLQIQREAQEFQFELQSREHENKIALKELDTFRFLQDQDQDDNGIPDQFEIEKFKTEAALKLKKLDLEARKLAQDKELKEKDLAIKRSKKPTK